MASHSNTSQSSSLAFLRELFPAKVNVGLLEAGLALGLGRQTCYNLLGQNKFPVPSFKIGHKRFVCLLDLAAVLDQQRGVAPVVDVPREAPREAPVPTGAVRRRGRPTKAEEIAARGRF